MAFNFNFMALICRVMAVPVSMVAVVLWGATAHYVADAISESWGWTLAALATTASAIATIVTVILLWLERRFRLTSGLLQSIHITARLKASKVEPFVLFVNGVASHEKVKPAPKIDFENFVSESNALRVALRSEINSFDFQILVLSGCALPVVSVGEGTVTLRELSRPRIGDLEKLAISAARICIVTRNSEICDDIMFIALRNELWRKTALIIPKAADTEAVNRFRFNVLAHVNLPEPGRRHNFLSLRNGVSRELSKKTLFDWSADDPTKDWPPWPPSSDGSTTARAMR